MVEALNIFGFAWSRKVQNKDIHALKNKVGQVGNVETSEVKRQSFQRQEASELLKPS